MWNFIWLIDKIKSHLFKISKFCTVMVWGRTDKILWSNILENWIIKITFTFTRISMLQLSQQRINQDTGKIESNLFSFSSFLKKVLKLKLIIVLVCIEAGTLYFIYNQTFKLTIFADLQKPSLRLKNDVSLQTTSWTAVNC